MLTGQGEGRGIFGYPFRVRLYDWFWLAAARARRDNRSKVDTVRSQKFPGSMLVEIEAHVADSTWVAQWTMMSGTGGFIISE